MADGHAPARPSGPHRGNAEPRPGLLSELLDELESVQSKWKDIGLKLGIEYHELEVIREDRSQRGGVSDSFSAMLNKWLSRTNESPNKIWIKICEVLKKIKENRLAISIAQKHGVSPRIVKQPQDQCAMLGGTVTFRCKASISGPQITFKWMHTRDGRDSKVEPEKTASAELSIKGVTEGHRGKYRCVVNNEFGGHESDSAGLRIGKELNPDSLKRILNVEGIKDADWPEIGECLGQADLRSTFIGGIVMRIQECSSDKSGFWLKIAQILEGMEAAALKAKKNAGKAFKKSTVIELFKEPDINIKDPDWCKIYEVLLNQQHKKFEETEKQQNTEHAHQESCSVDTIIKHRNITWEKLAKALDGIQGYEFAAEKIRAECIEVEITRDTLDDVFTDASRVNWHPVVETFPSFNKSCLIEVLKKWLSEQKGQDPWIYWRKLAASVESLKEGSEDPKEVKCQLGIGYKLRLRFGVGLELNRDSLFKVLKDAGIKDWRIIVTVLKLDPNWAIRMAQKLVDFFWNPDPIHKQILDKWPEPQSWEELARAINDSEDLKTGPEIAQKTRQLSGSGGFPIINHLYSDPPLKSKNVTSEKTVTFKCEARGASPLKYTWMCDGDDLCLKDSWTVELKLEKGGRYNCRVENDFGSCISKYPLQLVCGDAPTCKFDDQQNRNIQTGHKLHLHCTARGTELLTYTWLHDGDELQEYDGPDLVIMQVQPDAAGRYQCRVANDFGNDTSTIEIKVGDPPQIKSFGFKGPQKKHYEKDVTLDFYCEATGAPTYTWRRLRGSSNPEVGHSEHLVVVTDQETEGQYTCQVKNDFGDITSDPIEIKVGVKPIVKAPPEIAGKVVPGEQVQLTCAVEGNRPFEYVWMHDNQTLVKEARSCLTEAELSIEEMTAADQGEYKCRFINSFGFDVSEPVLLHIGIELEELMKQLCTPISQGWYMFGILLDVKKSILVRISRGFVASRDVKYSLQEVIVSWLEMKHNPKRPHSWATIQDVVQRMGKEDLARDLGSLFKTASLTQKKPEEHDSKYMRRGFERLAGELEKMFTIPDSADTESGSTRRNTDAVVSGIRAYLHLIGFKDEDIQEITDLHSVVEILRQYLNYQRYHLLEKVIFQFGSKEAQSEMRAFTEQFSEYQETTSLGNFVPLTPPPDDDHSKSEGDPPNIAVKKPPFMHSFKIMLEIKWATCTLRDAENLLVNLLPDTVGREFVWYSTAYRPEDNSVCLEYLVSPTVVELLGKEMEMRKQTLRSMGIHCVYVDSTVFETYQKSSKTRAHTEEQGANPLAMQLLMQKLEELRDEVPQRRIKKTRTEQASEIETVQQDPQETESKQDSEEIEALRTALEETKMAFESTKTALETALDDTRNAHDREIKALQQKVEALKKNTTAVTTHQRDKALLKAEIKSIKEAMSEEIEEKMTHHVASLESDMDLKIRQGIRKYSKQAPTRSLLNSVSSPTEKVSPGSAGERIGENASENDYRSQEQRQTQEPLDAASILKEIREAQQRMESTMREESQRMESRMREESELSAKKFEELKLKLDNIETHH